MSLIVLVGAGAPFSVGVQSQGPGCPFTYQWRYFDVYLLGATTSSILVTNVQTNFAGPFSVAVTDSRGSVTSSVANLTVVAGPVISNQSALVGSDVTLSASVHAPSGAGPFSRQWLFNGAELSGATNLTLSLTNVQLFQAGAYAVTVSNPAGFVTTTNAILDVIDPAPRLSGLRWGTNGAYFDVTGAANTTYRIQATMGWKEWIDIATNAVPASGGSFPVRDSDATNFSWRCYRAITP